MENKYWNPSTDKITKAFQDYENQSDDLRIELMRACKDTYESTVDDCVKEALLDYWGDESSRIYLYYPYSGKKIDYIEELRINQPGPSVDGRDLSRNPLLSDLLKDFVKDDDEPELSARLLRKLAAEITALADEMDPG